MTIRSAPYYWLVCDQCGCSSTGIGRTTSKPALIHAAQYLGWTLHATQHRCPACSQAHHNPKDHPR